MAAYSPADSTDGTSFIVSKTCDINVIFTLMVWGVYQRLIATTVTTTVEFRGLTRAKALEMAASADYNYRSLHGVEFTGASSEYPSASMKQDQCEGTECRADARRINDADMWRVIVTHKSTTVTHSGGWHKDTY